MITTTLIALTLTVTPTHSGWEQTVPEVHVVAEGESLSSIDTSEGSPGPWTRLAFVNRDAFEDPNVIDVGTVLVIPHADGRRLQWTPPTPSFSSGSSDTSWAPSSATSSGGGSCGGDLPPCSVMYCESGGDIHAENSTSSASGKWQVTSGTWGGYGGYDSAADAPEEVQDAWAADLWDGGAGASHWEQCL